MGPSEASLDVFVVVNCDVKALRCTGIAMCSICSAHDGFTIVGGLNEFETMAGILCSCGEESRATVSQGFDSDYRELASMAVASWNAKQGVNSPFSFGLSDIKIAKQFKWIGVVVGQPQQTFPSAGNPP